jgi:adenylate cyclase, class 2
MALEREIKLRFPGVSEARGAVVATGATPRGARRLQQDSLLDTSDGLLRERGCALRIRQETGRAILTFKGPVTPAAAKLREELETPVQDAAILVRILNELGFDIWFRYEKHREEFAGPDVIIAVDETPIGTFVEIEGSDEGIRSTAAALGRSEADYILHSYRELFLDDCARRSRPATDMLFIDG